MKIDVNNSETLTHPNYRADIDGLRAIAVLSVIGFHAFPHTVRGGFIGVDIFFVISGFLISSIIFDNLYRDRFSFAEFYTRRIKRIFPALLMVLIACYAFGWFALYADEYEQLGKHIAGGAGFISNLVLLSESGYFDNSAETKPLLHLWSLGIEEQFYIVWPLLLWFTWKLRLNLLTITIVVAVISFALNIVSVRSDAAVAFYSPLTRFWALLAGSSLAYIKLQKMSFFAAPTYRLDNVQSFFGASLIAIGILIITEERSFPGWWAVLPTMGTALIISAGNQAWVNSKVLSNRVLVWFGLISYPLYLWHWVLLSFARIVESATPSREVRITAVGISIVLAWLTYKLIEKPIRFGKNSAVITIALVLLMVVVGSVGYNTYRQNGLEFRQNIHHSSLNQIIRDQFVGPLWKYAQNDVCLNRYPFKESAEYQWWFCMASKDEAPTLLLLGSSRTNQLYPGFEKHSRLEHHSILSIGTCDPAKVDESELDYEKNLSHPCHGHRALQQEKFIDNLIENSDSVKYAILDGLDRDPGSEYISRLKKRIDFLEMQNIKVIIFAPHIRADYDIRACFARPFATQKRKCELDLEARRALADDFRPLVEQLSKTNSNVEFFDPNNLFCNNEKCSMLHNGMPLFRDEYHHLSEHGSGELANVFVKWASTNVPEILE